MLTVNLIPKNSPNALTFVFKHFKNADELYKKASLALKDESIIEAEDDFETRCIVRMGDIAAITFSEYEKDMDKNGDMQIIQHKCRLKTENKAKNDVGLRLLDSATPQISQ